MRIEKEVVGTGTLDKFSPLPILLLITSHLTSNVGASLIRNNSWPLIVLLLFTFNYHYFLLFITSPFIHDIPMALITSLSSRTKSRKLSFGKVISSQVASSGGRLDH